MITVSFDHTFHPFHYSVGATEAWVDFVTGTRSTMVLVQMQNGRFSFEPM